MFLLLLLLHLFLLCPFKRSLLLLKLVYQPLQLVLLWLLLSVGVATTSAPMMSPPPSSAPMVPSSIMLVPVSTSTFSHPRVSLDHIYTSNDANSLWGMGYKPNQKTPIGFVSAFDKNLIHLAGIQHSMNSAKVFLQRSLAILEENGQRQQEALRRVIFLEVEVAK